tara:strand:- start:102 stop:503 length:402 start_codon:yes stop_codon:yes gene_type:complete
MAYDIIAQESATTATTTSPEEIAIWMYMADNSYPGYTVPTGKIFKGWMLARDTSSSCDYTITYAAISKAAKLPYGNEGGTTLAGTMYHVSTGFEGKWPIYLNAGDNIQRRSSHPWYLMGLETIVNTVSWDTSS